MPRFILTGAPGVGKTTIIERLRDEGFRTGRESFMDLYHQLQKNGVTDPLAEPDFIDRLVSLQAKRQRQLPWQPGERQYFDRSPLCTLALSLLMQKETSDLLQEEVTRAVDEGIYSQHVFFVRNLGYVESDEIRTLNYEQTLEFERLHREVYESYGFRCLDIPAMTVEQRTRLVLKLSDEANA